MKKDILKKVRKDKLVVKELRRAHLMIALLAIAVGTLALLINPDGLTGLNAILVTSLVAFSGIIAVISLFVVYKLSQK